MSSLPERLLKPDVFEVWPEHEDAILMFLRCQTQWRAGGNGIIGMDYGVVLQVMDLYAVGNRRQVLEDLQIMEAHAKELFNKESTKPEVKAKRRK